MTDQTANPVTSPEPVEANDIGDAALNADEVRETGHEQTAAPVAAVDETRPVKQDEPTQSADEPGEPGDTVASPEPADVNDITDMELNADEVHETLHMQITALMADAAFYSEDPTTSQTDADEPVPAEPDEPTRPADNPGEPGGPAPPQHRAA
nr:hypothetical protein [Mycobacterium sp. GA-2829]